MKKLFLSIVTCVVIVCAEAQQVLVFHTIQTDSVGNLIPWYNVDPGTSYDHDLSLIWNFWNHIPDSAGFKFYMMDHEYSPTLQGSRIGGDQFAMAISSEELYYAYTGDTAVLNNMIYIANTYLANSLSAAADSWPNLPYPCNFSNPETPVYDGDYIGTVIPSIGPGVTQPDKAGSFGAELVTLYKITGDTNYLHTAINIANTLAAKVQPGDSNNSPYYFRIRTSDGSNPTSAYGAAFAYCGNVSPTMRLFESLNALKVGNIAQYDTAFNVIKRWVRTYPERTNQWGTFFEDIGVPSNTETNAVTMAYYILQHPDWSTTYIQEARAILDWTLSTFGNTTYDTLGVTAINEQTADLKPGGSHTSRYASAELLYSLITGDTTRLPEAIRQLNWATYLVDTNGQCRFSPAENSIWYTDGYGDYVRHFLRAMSSYPSIAPDSANHLLGTNSIITYINYQPQIINYSTWDSSSTEVLRLTSKPLKVKVDGADISEVSNLNGDGWVWTTYPKGGVLNVSHINGHNVEILWTLTSLSDITATEEFNLFPNPAATNVNINFRGFNSQKMTLEVINGLGQTLICQNVMLTKGSNKISLNIESLSPGAYFVKVKTQTEQIVKPFIINR